MLCSKMMPKLYLAGYMVRGGNTLLADFILVAKRLEWLGLTYHNGQVIMIDRGEEWSRV